MIDLKLQNYTDWHVKPVMKIKGGYGYRVILKFQDGSEKTQQKAGFRTVREADASRTQTIGELYNGTYKVYGNVSVSDFMQFWLENDIRHRVKSYETYYNFSGIVKNHIIPVLGNKKMTAVTAADIQADAVNEQSDILPDIDRYLKNDG